ncbi:MAG: zinc ribbon domain-containing protein [Eubacterium sp.]|nr:zinc ribbon domain-containing protein [Eubacterium sp.]
MKFCYNCGSPIEEEGSRFCVDCGADLSLADVEEDGGEAEREEMTRRQTGPVNNPQHEQEKYRQENTWQISDRQYEEKGNHQLRQMPLVQRDRIQSDQYVQEETNQQSSQSILAQQVAEKKETGKSHPVRSVLIFLLCCVLIIGGVLAFDLLVSVHKTGYETIEEAANKDIELIGQRKEAELFDEITSEEWKVVFDQYKTQLNRVSITGVGELKSAVKEKAGEYHYKQDIDDLFIRSTAVIKDKSYLPYYLQSLKYDIGIANISFKNHLGRIEESTLYYYKNGSKWYSALGLRTVDALTQEVVYQGRNSDIEAAEKIGTNVLAALANEDAYDDTREYADSDFAIVKAFGGNAFVSNVGKPVDSFLKELNKNLGGTAPELKYPGPVNGWTPKGWAVFVYKQKPYVKVYITDGTMEHMVEMYPNVDENYK